MQKMIESKNVLSSMIGVIRATYKIYGKGSEGFSHIAFFPEFLYHSGCLSSDKKFLLDRIITNMFFG